ncbi:MAG: hypothetical protein ACYSUL_13875 [Planctomycetota bacterium]|jgi:hypothetical protein
MDHIIFFISFFVILIPVILFVFNRKLYYYSVILLYPLIGQLINLDVEIFSFSINPSMVFGFLVLAMTALDFLFHPSKNLMLEITVAIFILYSIITCAFSPTRFISLSWSLKIATWLLILLSSIKLFVEEKDLYQIHLVVSIGVLIVIFSFLLSWLGYYGESFTYETGVKSHGAGFSSGKTLAYYLTISIPVLALRTLDKNNMGWGLSCLLVIISAIVIVLTFVRAPIIALFVGFLTYQYFGYKYGNKRLLMSFAPVILAILIIFVTFSLFEESQYASRWTELGNKYVEGDVEKLGSGRVGGLMSFFEYYFYKATMVNKIFGSGLGSSAVYLGSNKFIHNDFAEILMGCGIIGFSLYILIIVKIFGLLMTLINNSQLPRFKKYGILALSNLFIFLSFHMTNISSGVFILSVWAIYTGATIGLGQSQATDRENKWEQLFQRKEKTLQLNR